MIHLYFKILKNNVRLVAGIRKDRGACYELYDCQALLFLRWSGPITLFFPGRIWRIMSFHHFISPTLSAHPYTHRGGL